MAASRILLFAGVLFALIFTHAASAQTISIVQGAGQLDCEGCATGTYPFLDDEVVLVTDASGNPVGNATVNWTVVAADGFNTPQGTLDHLTTVTSSGTSGAGLCFQVGYSCNRYSGNDTGGQFLRVMAVTASLASNSQSVTFTLTETPNPVASGATEQNANAQVTGPAINTLFQGTSGTTSSTPITVSVFTNSGQPIPNVSVRLVPDFGTPAGSPTASCATAANADPGSTLTNSSGIATCNVVFGPIPSTGQAPNFNLTFFRVLIGGIVAPQQVQNVQDAGSLGLGGPNGFAAPLAARYELIVTPATPNAVQIISGNNQTANPGQNFAASLVVEVLDGSSPPNTLSSIPVTWTVSPAGAATVTPASSTTGSNGQTSVNVILSSTAAGPVSVTATTANGKSATFTLTANVLVTVTTLNIVSGNNQSVPVGQAFQPITVQVTTSGGRRSVLLCSSLSRVVLFPYPSPAIRLMRTDSQPSV